MQITCMAIQGYYVYMSLDDGFSPSENTVFPPLRRVTINAACSSSEMKWNYVLTSGGMNYAILFSSATCDQIPCLGAC
uniref:ZP domain-containing protein n=1 Tax=Caenorhabditis tropicalis TaxID=1561998 RepID=A0A1I7UVI1_9PELO